MVIQSVESDETLERWSFTIEGDQEMEKAKKGEEVEVDLKEIQKGIKDVVRQIVATSKLCGITYARINTRNLLDSVS